MPHNTLIAHHPPPSFWQLTSSHVYIAPVLHYSKNKTDLLGRFHYWLPATQVTSYEWRLITPHRALLCD